MAEHVLDTLEQLARREPMRAGLRVRFGWSQLTLIGTDGGDLTVCEPDFDRDPLRDTRPRLETTLDVIAAQATFVRHTGLAPVDVFFDQYLVVARGALAASAVQLYRDPAARADDSGWSVTAQGSPPAEDAADAWDGARVFTLLRSRPSLLRVLALPPGCVVVLEGDRVTDVLDSGGRKRTGDR
jgi:hypothetical protein